MSDLRLKQHFRTFTWVTGMSHTPEGINTTNQWEPNLNSVGSRVVTFCSPSFVLHIEWRTKPMV